MRIGHQFFRPTFPPPYLMTSRDFLSRDEMSMYAYYVNTNGPNGSHDMPVSLHF